MNRIGAALLLLLALCGSADAQSSPGWGYGFVPTPAQWNTAFANKQDYLGSNPCLVIGCTFTGEVITAASTTAVAGLNIPPGTAPTSPINGDFWETSAGVFARVNGTTLELTASSSGSFAATSPLAVTFPSSVVTYALNIGASLTTSGGNLVINPANANVFTALQTVDLGSGAEPTASTGAALASYGADGVISRHEATAFANSVSGTTAVFDGRTSQGTRASPGAVTSGTLLASFEGKGYDTSVWTGTGAAFHAYAESSTWTSSSHPGEACMATTLSGATATTDQLCVHNDGGMTLGSPTGGDKGAGTINVASNFFVNGTGVSAVNPGGSNTQVQYNNSSVFGGISGVTTNGTAITAMAVALGSDATGDVYYRNSSGNLTRLGIGSTSNVMQVSGGLPAWSAVATTSQIWGGNAGNILDAGNVFNAAGVFQALSGTTSVTPNFAAGINFTFTATSGDSYTLQNPTNMKAGQSGCINLNQPASGSAVGISFGTDWVFANATTPGLTGTLGALDVLCYQVGPSATTVLGSMFNGVAP